jgi:hypothetical protein
MSGTIPVRTFIGSTGYKTVSTRGPSALIADLDSIFDMFDGNITSVNLDATGFNNWITPSMIQAGLADVAAAAELSLRGVNPTWTAFGAVGDGVADDAAAIQAAATYAAAHGYSLFIPKPSVGFRITTAIIHPRNLEIHGLGSIDSHIINDSGGPAFTIQGTGTDYLTRLLHPKICGLYITTPSTTGSITAGSNLLTVAAVGTMAVGRVVRVAGAGTAGRNLVSVITNVSGLVVTLTDNAVATVTSAAVTNADAIGVYCNIVGQGVVRDIITDGGLCGVKMVDGSEVEFSNIEAHGCRWPLWFECTGNVTGDGNKDFAAVIVRDFTLSSYDEDGIYIKNIRHIKLEGKSAIAHNTTDTTKAGIRLVAASGALWTDRSNKLIDVEGVLIENMYSAPQMIIESADIVNLRGDYLSSNNNPKVIAKNCRILNVSDSNIDNYDFTTEANKAWLKLESTVPSYFKLNIEGDRSRYNADIAILDERTTFHPLFNYGMQQIPYPDMARNGCAVTATGTTEPAVDGVNFFTGYNSLYWANAGNGEIYVTPNITNLDELQPGDTIIVEAVCTDNMKIKFLHPASYIEPTWSYYTVQALTTGSGVALKRKVAKLTLTDKLNGIRITNEDNKTGFCDVDWLQVYCRRKLNVQNMFTYGINPESTADFYGTFKRGEKIYALDHHVEWEVITSGSYGTLTATAVGTSGESTITATIAAGQIYPGAIVNISGSVTDYTVTDIDDDVWSLVPALNISPAGAAITFRAPVWQPCGFSSKAATKTLSPTPGVSNVYGTGATAYAGTGFRGLVPLMCKIVFGAGFAGGETVTVKLTCTYLGTATVKYVEVAAVADGTVWLTNEQIAALWLDGYMPNGLVASSKTSAGSTSVTTVVDPFGIYV